MPKTGPRSRRGKAIVKRNALQHGIFAEVPVLPDVEDETVWKQFRADVLEDLEPEGAIESLLAERIASISWRLKRVTRYEREYTTYRMSKIGSDIALSRMIVRKPMPHEIDDEFMKEVRDAVTVRLLPDDDVLNKIIKYETHLTRQLRTARHDLEALQTRRKGGDAPLARLDITSDAPVVLPEAGAGSQ